MVDDQVRDERQLGAWSRVHAVIMLVALAATLRGMDPLLLMAASTVSFGGLLALFWHRYTPKGRFGLANTISLLRLAMLWVLCGVFMDPTNPGPEHALWLIGFFTLDGVDGWLARRLGDQSRFGAHFDMEIDALSVLVAALVLFGAGRVGAFVLVPGALRYGYVLTIWWAKTDGREAPRSRAGRYVFSLMVVALCTSLWPIEPIHRPLIAFASAAIAAAFAHSLYWSLSPRLRSLAATRMKHRA